MAQIKDLIPYTQRILETDIGTNTGIQQPPNGGNLSTELPFSNNSLKKLSMLGGSKKPTPYLTGASLASNSTTNQHMYKKKSSKGKA